MSAPGRRLLYIAPAFLSYRLHKVVRGVQVFDMLFIRDLVGMGIDVTVPAEISWWSQLRARLTLPDGRHPRFRWTPPLIKPQWNGLFANLLVHGRFDTVYLGNGVRGAVPMIDLLRARRMVGRLVIQANRVPRPPVERAMRRWSDARIVAVSELVKSGFSPDLRSRVEVKYGLVDAHDYTPRSDEQERAHLAAPAEVPAGAGEPLTHFFLLGKLDTPVKDAPAAVRAFAAMPEGVRSRCRLHLVGYPDPRDAGDLPQGVLAYPWMDSGDIAGFLRGMDVLLVTSTTETFGQSAVQAMLSGLPTIANDLPTMREKLDPPDGEVTDLSGDGTPEQRAGLIYRTHEELVTHMSALATNPGLRRSMGRVARTRALERYVWDSSAFAREYFGVC